MENNEFLSAERSLIEVFANSSNYSFSEVNEAIQKARALLDAPARPVRFADLPKPASAQAPAYWVDEFGCTIQAGHKARNESLGGAPATVARRYTIPLYAEQPASVELMRDALDHIAKTCHQSRQQSRRIRWIEARANGALEGKPYDEKLLELPVEVDREIDRLKRRDRRQLDRIQFLEQQLREAQPFTNDVAHDPDVWLKIERALVPGVVAND